MVGPSGVLPLGKIKLSATQMTGNIEFIHIDLSHQAFQSSGLQMNQESLYDFPKTTRLLSSPVRVRCTKSLSAACGGEAL